jgi:hypothetical protein
MRQNQGFMHKGAAILASFFLTLFVTSIALNGQQADTIWTRTFGGSAEDVAHAMIPSGEGGITLFGYTSSFGSGGYDILLVRVDSAGNEIWSRTIGDIHDDIAYDAATTADGGFIIAGKTWPVGGNGFDVYLVRTNGLGDTLWTRYYGGIFDDAAYGVQQTSDGGYILAGGSESSSRTSLYVYVIKTDSLGDTLWTRKYGGSNGDVGEAVFEYGINEYYVAGRKSGMALLMKIDSLGNSLWERTFSGGIFHSMKQVSDSVFGMVGGDFITANLNGDTIWTNPSEGRAFQHTADGGFILSGGTADITLAKIDMNGTTLWETIYGGTGQDAAYAVQEIVDSIYLIAGSTDSYGSGFKDVYLIKTKPYPKISYTPQLYCDTLWEDQVSTNSLAISNIGTIDLEWTLTEQKPVGWIFIPDTSGIVVPGQSDSLIFRFLSRYLEYGDYCDTLLLATNDCGNPLIKVPVQLTVISPDMDVAPRSFSITLPPEQILDERLQVINKGNYQLRFDVIEHPSVGWLAVVPTSDSTLPGDTSIVTITLNSSGLGSGLFTDTVLVQGNYGGNKTIPATIRLRVTANLLTVDPSNLSAVCRNHESFTETLSIWNSGEISLTWSLAETPDVPWLSANPTAGSIDAWSREPVTLVFSPAGLSSGIYHDTISIFSSSQQNNPLRVPIKLSVFADSGPFIFPNPFKPCLGNAGITFGNLPQSGKIEVYTISGYRVWEVSFGENPGAYTWKVETTSGKPLANGIYQYIIKDSSGQTMGRGLFSVLR